MVAYVPIIVAIVQQEGVEHADVVPIKAVKDLDVNQLGYKLGCMQPRSVQKTS